MAATITEIAKNAGVSVGLVSRMFSGDPSLRISDEKRNHVLSVSKELGGLERSRRGRSLKKKKIARGFTVPCMGRDVFDGVKAHFEIGFFDGFSEIIREHGFRLSLNLLDPRDGIGAFEDLVASVGYCDGLLLLPDSAYGVDKNALGKLLRDNQFPHVCYDVEMESFGLNTVFENGAMGINQAVEYLKSLGHRRIGYLGRYGSRYGLFCAAMGRSLLPIDKKLDCMNPMDGNSCPSVAEGWRDTAKVAFAHWLREGVRATALICQNDYSALGAIDAMREAGLVVGRDISLVGYDNIEVHGPKPVENPVVSTIDFTQKTVGRRCGELLLHQTLYGQTQIVHERLPVDFLVRQSTGPCLEVI